MPTLERTFEDDGFPLAILEVDEARDIHEVSLYVGADDLGRAEAEMRRIVRAIDQKLTVESETLPDIDWVARSLEGLKPVRAGRFFVHGAHDRALQPHRRHRHRDRGRPCLRHRPSRHHRRLPRNDRPRGAPRTAAQRARPRHRQRRAGHRRRQAGKNPGAGDRHRSGRGARGAAECPPQRRVGLCPGGHRDRLPPSGLRGQCAVRPDRRQHPGQAADAARARHGTAHRAGRLADPVRHPRPPARRRRRRLCRPALPPCRPRCTAKAG